MNSFSSRSLPVLVLFIFSALLFDLTYAQDKPLLSEAIKEAIDARGVEAAKEYFLEMDKPERAQYSIDTEGISELTTFYVNEGNMDALMAVSEISAPFMQDMVTQAMEEYAPEMEKMEQMAEQQRVKSQQQQTEREEERNRQREKSSVERQGQPHDDLERFTGLYANPDAEESSTRQLWVQVSCDGSLVSGAMWGDASPWWLRSESDNVFTSSNSFNSIRMEFRTGDSGSLEMVHDLEFMPSPLQRIGSLPSDWDSCLERYR